MIALPREIINIIYDYLGFRECSRLYCISKHFYNSWIYRINCKKKRRLSNGTSRDIILYLCMRDKDNECIGCVLYDKFIKAPERNRGLDFSDYNYNDKICGACYKPKCCGVCTKRCLCKNNYCKECDSDIHCCICKHMLCDFCSYTDSEEQCDGDFCIDCYDKLPVCKKCNMEYYQPKTEKCPCYKHED